MITELRTLNEINLQNFEEFNSISNKINVLDKNNHHGVLDKTQDEDGYEIDKIIEGMEDQIHQLENEMDLELTYVK